MVHEGHLQKQLPVGVLNKAALGNFTKFAGTKGRANAHLSVITGYFSPVFKNDGTNLYVCLSKSHCKHFNFQIYKYVNKSNSKLDSKQDSKQDVKI